MAFYRKDYDDELWRLADERARAMPIYPGSHRGLAANQVGALGEVLVESLLTAKNIPFSPRYSTRFDIEVGAHLVEVKTKDRTVRPRLDFGCSVPLYNHEHQVPSRYIFVSLLRQAGDDESDLARYRAGFVLGWCTREMIDSGRTWRAGEVDPDNGTKFWTACKNVLVRDLLPMEDFLREQGAPPTTG